MGAQQRVYKQRIRSTQTLKKMFRAMELIAASRIGRARDQATKASPYAIALTRATSAVAAHAHVGHPILRERSDTNRVAVLVLAADRGMAGSYTASVLRAAEQLTERLTAEGKEIDLYVVGRRGIGYFTFRDQTIVKSWEGQSDKPDAALARDISETLLQAFLAPADAGGVAELHIVFTKFVSMVSQEPFVRRMLPLEVVEGVAEAGAKPLPLYEFEPSADAVLDQLLPLYVRSRIYNALLQAAASELASRQRAMHTAVENAEDLIGTYTRLANTARQAEITQELTEIVSGADALAAS
ncbi:F0F1 ATP synthase subunit gamma [Georgenia sp. H159]|uniref:F0F1 ATP synthase subunit gamma n=1 Tax=Georgenia sp. H159 TaxID=3076115 RepID=UPI002D77D660|nr:F0F1 ATP synthase subunit gamma [Georgenia sp. H159]